MCRTDTAPHDAFSLLILPTAAPGYRIVRETPILGIHGGHYEIELNRVRVPQTHLLGARGHGFRIAQQRLGGADSQLPAAHLERCAGARSRRGGA
jgi:alkylation response protein AidB-like acyl-CoA dehydrogenase